MSLNLNSMRVHEIICSPDCRYLDEYKLHFLKQIPISILELLLGKSLGRTKLTEISPKKTVEGAIGGLASSIAVAVGLSKLTQWPPTPLAAAGLGVRQPCSDYRL